MKMGKLSEEQKLQRFEKRRIERLSNPSSNAKVSDLTLLANDIKGLVEFALQLSANFNVTIDLLVKKGVITEDELVSARDEYASKLKDAVESMS